VQDHAESTRLQYGLAERAITLGWAPSRVLVIDEELGHSASGADARPGFARLVAEVGLDHVGIVLGIEMSRLARSGREWHQLLELCALSGALLGDLDGVYDPAGHNDRSPVNCRTPVVPTVQGHRQISPKLRRAGPPSRCLPAGAGAAWPAPGEGEPADSPSPMPIPARA